MSHPLFPGSVACKKPKFQEHQGRTWDTCEIIAKDGSRHEGLMDTSWGQYFYFKPTGKQWRKARCDRFMQGVYNIANFQEVRTE